MVQLSGGTYLSYSGSFLNFNFTTADEELFSFLGYLMIHIAKDAKPLLEYPCSVGIKVSDHL